MIYDKIISPEELKIKLDNKEDLLLIDTRENTSFLKPIDKALLIPASKILEKLDILPKNKPIIIICTHGVDSFFLMNILITQYKYSEVYSLKTGLEGWHQLLENSGN